MLTVPPRWVRHTDFATCLCGLEKVGLQGEVSEWDREADWSPSIRWQVGISVIL